MIRLHLLSWGLDLEFMPPGYGLGQQVNAPKLSTIGSSAAGGANQASMKSFAAFGRRFVSIKRIADHCHPIDRCPA